MGTKTSTIPVWSLILMAALLTINTEAAKSDPTSGQDAKEPPVDDAKEVPEPEADKPASSQERGAQVTDAPKPAPSTAPAVVEEGTFLVRQDGKVCARATFHADFRVKYAYRRPDKRLRVHEKVIEMPEENVKVTGTCTKNSTQMTLTWLKGNFTLVLDFKPQKKKSGGEAGWSTEKIHFTLDTRDKKLFDTPLHPGKYTMKSKPGRSHFWSPRNHSFSCTTRQKVTLLQYDSNGTVMEENVVQVAMYMSEAQIQAFDLQANGKFSEGASCEADIFHNMPRQNIVPIVVAACLTGIIVIIIIAYFISKNIGQSAYRPMD